MKRTSCIKQLNQEKEIWFSGWARVEVLLTFISNNKYFRTKWLLSDILIDAWLDAFFWLEYQISYKPNLHVRVPRTLDAQNLMMYYIWKNKAIIHLDNK